MKILLQSIQLFVFSFFFSITIIQNISDACNANYYLYSTSTSIGAIPINATNEATCEAACTADDKCLSFQLDYNNVNSSFCWLQKTPSSIWRPTPNIIEFIKSCAATNATNADVCYTVRNQGFRSIGATGIRNLSKEDCEKLCNNTVNCFAYQIDLTPDTITNCWIQNNPTALYNLTYSSQTITEYIKLNCSGINFCASLPCGPGNKCTLFLNDYKCDCNAGYIQNGTRNCKDVDECLVNACQNNGLCRNLMNKFDCICPSTHFGDICQYEKNSSIDSMYSMIKPQILEKHKFSISGGSTLTIYGKNLILFECSGAYLIPDNVLEATSLYANINKNKTINNETIQLIIPYYGNNSANILTYYYVVLDYNGYNISLPKDQNLQYIPDPIIDDMNPKTPLIFGNVSLVISGRNLLGVNPEMTYHVKATFLNELIFGNFISQCLVLNDNTFKCPFEGFNNFPEGFKNESNIALGLQFDVIVSYTMGYFLNYSDGNGFLQNPVFNEMGLSLKKPSFSEFNQDEIYFVPGETLKIKGNDLTVGVSQFDYIVKVGQANCDVKIFLNELIECLPPQQKPPILTKTSTFCRKPDAFELTISILKEINRPNIIYCVVYEDKFPMLAIIGILAAGILLIITFIYICYICYKKRASKELKLNKMGKIIDDITIQHSRFKRESDAERHIQPHSNVADSRFMVNEDENRNYINESETFHHYEDVETENENYLNAFEMVDPINDGFVIDGQSFSHISRSDGDWMYSAVKRKNKLFVDNNKRVTYTRPQLYENYIGS